MRIKLMYSTALNTIAPMTVIKLNEKMMMSNDARMETIIIANKEIGKPKMTARFLMFL